MSEKGDLALQKLDAILDVMTTYTDKMVKNSQLVAPLSDIQSRVNKLKGEAWNGKEMSSEALMKSLGTSGNVATASSENQQYWEAMKLSIVNSVMRAEGFWQTPNGKWPLGPTNKGTNEA